MRLYVWRNETATNFNWIQLPLFLLISWTRKKIHSIQWNVTPVQRRLVWKISYLFICFVFGFFFFSCCLNFRLVSVFGFHPNWALCTKKSGFLTHPSQYITGQPIHSVCAFCVYAHDSFSRSVCIGDRCAIFQFLSVVCALFSNCIAFTANIRLVFRMCDVIRRQKGEQPNNNDNTQGKLVIGQPRKIDRWENEYERSPDADRDDDGGDESWKRWR